MENLDIGKCYRWSPLSIHPNELRLQHDKECAYGHEMARIRRRVRILHQFRVDVTNYAEIPKRKSFFSNFNDQEQVAAAPTFVKITIENDSYRLSLMELSAI